MVLVGHMDLLLIFSYQKAYREEVQNVHLDLEDADLVSSLLEGKLSRLEAAATQWVELTKLLDQLNGVLDEMVCHCCLSGTDPTHVDLSCTVACHVIIM